MLFSVLNSMMGNSFLQLLTSLCILVVVVIVVVVVV